MRRGMQQEAAVWCSLRQCDVCGTLMQGRELRASRLQRGHVPRCLLERLPNRRD